MIGADQKPGFASDVFWISIAFENKIETVGVRGTFRGALHAEGQGSNTST
jgi:hypothetical protein